jgi:hypothetical protein
MKIGSDQMHETYFRYYINIILILLHRTSPRIICYFLSYIFMVFLHELNFIIYQCRPPTFSQEVKRYFCQSKIRAAKEYL